MFGSSRIPPPSLPGLPMMGGMGRRLSGMMPGMDMMDIQGMIPPELMGLLGFGPPPPRMMGMPPMGMPMGIPPMGMPLGAGLDAFIPSGIGIPGGGPMLARGPMGRPMGMPMGGPPMGMPMGGPMGMPMGMPPMGGPRGGFSGFGPGGGNAVGQFTFYNSGSNPLRTPGLPGPTAMLEAYQDGGTTW